MTNRLLRLPLLLLALSAAAFAISACGSTHQPSTEGDSEGAYIQVGPLIYQVQLSRELNPYNVEDHQYLQGLPAGTPQPKADEEWFGVWMRVQNAGDHAQPAASGSDYKIVDTLGNTYRPIVMPTSNPFSYQARPVLNKHQQDLLPDPESAAGSGPVQASLLLFKLNTSVYSNRPLELFITPPGGGKPSRVELDL